MTIWHFLISIGLGLIVAGCSSTPVPSPFSDPRERGPFIAQSEFPHLPNVELAASSNQCAGEPLRAISAPMPDYPARGWSRGLQGWTIVQFDVDSTGQTDNVQIARGVPGGSFNVEAERAVTDWQFQALSTPQARLTGCVVLFEFRMGEVSLR